jgi:16S rRNA G966 N2-methylase RsmD
VPLAGLHFVLATNGRDSRVFGLFIDPPFEESSMKAQLIARERVRVEQAASIVAAEVS